MLIKFFKEKGDNAPRDISQMDRGSLTDEVRNYLKQKRYVVVFDDVWSVHFWDDIEFAVIDNKNGSKVLITTRNLDVVVSCEKSSFIEVLKLEPLSQEQSLELFNKKAFKFDHDGCCPKELIGIANEIVQKCNGLPLAIVAIGCLLSTREKTVFEWHRFRENLNLELKKDTHLIGIKEILGLSYDDLPYYLKSCLLYFVIYPEDYVVRSKRVIRQGIAEGFEKEERGKTLEEVAERYSTELIHRNLVQVSSLRIDGKVKRGRVHDLIREMILEKNEDLNFCKHISDDGQSTLSGITRRISVTTKLTSTSFYDLILNTERSRVRSLFIFGNNESTFLSFGRIPTKFRLLKILEYEHVRLLHVPNEVGSLIHLKYLSFNYIRDGKIPKSIGMLQNLETLEVRDTDTLQLPKEISKLRQLRHLIGTNISLIELKNGIGEMTSLQTLRNIDLDMDGAVIDKIASSSSSHKTTIFTTFIQIAEIAVSFAIDHLLPLLREEANLLRGVHKDFADIKDELESIQAFLKDADKKAASAEGDNTSEGVKTWVKQLREAAFRIEDIIDEYMIQVRQQPRDHGCVDLLHKLKSILSRRRIASEIQDINSYVRGIKERSERYGFQCSLEQGSSGSRRSQMAKWHDPRVAALYNEEADVVGFETQKDMLIHWLVKGREDRTVISVVGMGGQGKTTLAKKVLDNKDVIGHFDYRVWITVSQSYNVEGLLRDMLLKLYNQNGRDHPKDLFQMDRGSLTDEVRNNLQQKRYIVVFDDVWNVHFWDDIEFAVIDNKNESKILITTRNLDVVASCKRSSLVEVLELQPLTQEQSMELFNKMAFRFDYGGCCPKDFIDIVNEIVEKCKGLPLAIVAIGGLLSTREKNVFEWQRFKENLSLELKKDTHLIGIEEILGLSYDDLPYYLKSCLLYFGIYPEDYEVKSKRVIRQWIAEGFVKEERGKTLEEVAEGYLTELIHRNLVQVSSTRTDGKAKACRVHDLIRDMILEKFEDLNFCKHISDDGQSPFIGIIRRLSITPTFDDLLLHIEGSHIRSLFVFENEESYVYFEERIPTATTYRLLKVLDYESAPSLNVPKNLESLIHLKYLCFRHSYKVEEVPKSIGLLQNLETLDIRDAFICELPKEISKLRKLRHLISSKLSLIQLKDGIGEMTSLQTLRYIDLGMDGAAEIIKELGKLRQMRDLGLVNVGTEEGSILSSSISEMHHLEKLSVDSVLSSDPGNDFDFIDLHLISTPTMLRKLTLRGRLQKLPDWMLELQNLVELKLMYSRFTEDPIKSLKSLQNLLKLSIGIASCVGFQLHFEDGWFQKLKELYVGYADDLTGIIIDKGALPSLKKLELRVLRELKNLPTGIEHLEKLEVLHIQSMRHEPVQPLSIEDMNWITELVPHVEISSYHSLWE